MARLTPDAFTKIHIVDTIAVKAAPTVAEIAAGTEVTPFTTPAGLDTPEEGTDADSSDLSSARDKSVPATVGGTLAIECYRDDGTAGGSDDAWTAMPRLKDTHIVVARFGGTGADNAIQATDTVEVWQVRVSQRSNTRLARGDVMRFVVTFALQADMVDATVAA